MADGFGFLGVEVRLLHAAPEWFLLRGLVRVGVVGEVGPGAEVGHPGHVADELSAGVIRVLGFEAAVILPLRFLAHLGSS